MGFKQQRITRLGFTLVEILIVILMFGIFIGAVYSLYSAHVSTAFRQEEIVDVQQNLRIAMDAVTRDLQMAGFMISGSLSTINPAMSNYSSISINMASASKVYTRLTGDVTTADAQDLGPLPVVSVSDVDVFENVSAARIIRPLPACSEPYPADSGPGSNVFRVVKVDKNAASPSLTLRKIDNKAFAPDIDFKAGDVICRMDSTASPYPEIVSYSVIRNDSACGSGQSCLRRQINGRAEITAQNIMGLRFSYLLDDGTSGGAEIIDPSKFTPDDLARLRAVRITIMGQTIRKSSSGQTPGIRSMTSIVYLRNRR